jgi:hypothetical protein
LSGISLLQKRSKFFQKIIFNGIPIGCHYFSLQLIPDRGGNDAWSRFQLTPGDNVIEDCILNLSEIR